MKASLSSSLSPPHTPTSPQAQRDIIFELRRIAFDAEPEPNASSGSMEKRKSMYTRDYKKLGFIVSAPALSCGPGPQPGRPLPSAAADGPPSVGFACSSESCARFPDVLLV